MGTVPCGALLMPSTRPSGGGNATLGIVVGSPADRKPRPSYFGNAGSGGLSGSSTGFPSSSSAGSAPLPAGMRYSARMRSVGPQSLMCAPANLSIRSVRCETNVYWQAPAGTPATNSPSNRTAGWSYVAAPLSTPFTQLPRRHPRTVSQNTPGPCFLPPAHMPVYLDPSG
eukprot:81782-Chlamydomonas_euryale.AAC.5